MLGTWTTGREKVRVGVRVRTSEGLLAKANSARHHWHLIAKHLRSHCGHTTSYLHEGGGAASNLLTKQVKGNSREEKKRDTAKEAQHFAFRAVLVLCDFQSYASLMLIPALNGCGTECRNSRCMSSLPKKHPPPFPSDQNCCFCGEPCQVRTGSHTLMTLLNYGIHLIKTLNTCQ